MSPSKQFFTFRTIILFTFPGASSPEKTVSLWRWRQYDPSKHKRLFTPKTQHHTQATVWHWLLCGPHRPNHDSESCQPLAMKVLAHCKATTCGRKTGILKGHPMNTSVFHCQCHSKFIQLFLTDTIQLQHLTPLLNNTFQTHNRWLSQYTKSGGIRH